MRARACKEEEKRRRAAATDLGDEGVEWERDVAAQHLNHHPAYAMQCNSLYRQNDLALPMII